MDRLHDLSLLSFLFLSSLLQGVHQDQEPQRPHEVPQTSGRGAGQEKGERTSLVVHLNFLLRTVSAKPLRYHLMCKSNLQPENQNLLSWWAIKIYNWVRSNATNQKTTHRGLANVAMKRVKLEWESIRKTKRVGLYSWVKFILIVFYFFLYITSWNSKGYSTENIKSVINLHFFLREVIKIELSFISF